MNTFIHSSPLRKGTREEKGHQPQLWKNCFIASEYTFEKLRNICESVDAGIFILAPDDQLTAEGNNEFIVSF